MRVMWFTTFRTHPLRLRRMTQRCTIRVSPHFSARYSATNRRWQCSGVGSLHKSTVGTSKLARSTYSSTCRSFISARNLCSYSAQLPFPFLNVVRMSSVGASNGSCSYSIPQITRRKYWRSSRLVNPASCEELFRRTSRSRRTPACLRLSKKHSAVFWVKPIV